MKTLIIFGGFLIAALFFVVPRWKLAMDKRKAIKAQRDAIVEGQLDENAKLIRAVIQREQEAASIWLASFSPHAMLATICMLTFYAVFVMMDGAVAWYKGGIIAGVVFYFLVFWAVDTIQLNIVVSSDTGAGGAVSKARPVHVWIMIGLGFLLNIYISQIGYGIINNIVSTKTDSEAKANLGFKKKVASKRRRLDHLQKLHDKGEIRASNEVKVELEGLLLQEPKPQSGCKTTKHRGPWSKINCPKIDLLRVELSRARELEALQATVPELERQASKMSGLTDIDPTAGWVAWMFQEMGIKAEKLTVSELMGRLIMIVMSFLFPVMIFWWSDRAHEAKEERLGIVRAENNRALAKVGLTRNGEGEIVKASEGDAGLAAALGDMKAALEGNKVAFDANVLARQITPWLEKNVSKPMTIQDAYRLWREATGSQAKMTHFTDAINVIIMQPNNKLVRNGGVIYIEA